MKDSEFLELLNLYLDHEISANDATRLEAEVQAKANRRAVYQEYCRMQKACKIVAADFVVEGADGKRAPESAKVLQFADQSRRLASRAWFYVGGAAAAAAACVMLILAGQQYRRTDAGDAPANQGTTIANKPANETSTSITAVPSGTDSGSVRGLASVSGSANVNAHPRVTLVSESLMLSGHRQVEPVFAAAEQQVDDQLEWMRNFQLVSLQERKQIEQIRFETAAPTMRPEGRPLGGRGPTESTVELTAFRFVK